MCQRCTPTRMHPRPCCWRRHPLHTPPQTKALTEAILGRHRGGELGGRGALHPGTADQVRLLGGGRCRGREGRGARQCECVCGMRTQASSQLQASSLLGPYRPAAQGKKGLPGVRAAGALGGGSILLTVGQQQEHDRNPDLHGWLVVRPEAGRGAAGRPQELGGVSRRRKRAPDGPTVLLMYNSLDYRPCGGPHLRRAGRFGVDTHEWRELGLCDLQKCASKQTQCSKRQGVSVSRFVVRSAD